MREGGRCSEGDNGGEGRDRREGERGGKREKEEGVMRKGSDGGKERRKKKADREWLLVWEMVTIQSIHTLMEMLYLRKFLILMSWWMQWMGR